MNEYIVQIKNLEKVFGKQTALHNINADIPKGKIIGFAGSDGAGKTTLFRLLAGLLLPTQGSISVAGFDTIRSAKEIHDLIGYMPQRFGLYEDLTVLQNLNLYADLQGVVAEEREKVFKDLLSFTNLAPFKDRLAEKLSGGMKQKLGLACTLINKPTLLLLDEPSVGIDPLSRRELWKIVQNLLKEGISIFWSTAYLDEAEKCDEVLLLHEGNVLYYGPPQELTKRVEGRTYKMGKIQGRKRDLLFKINNQPSVVDAIIQGSEIRVVTKETGPFPKDIEALHAGEPYPVKARFEDAFVDLLGGAPKGTSKLAESANVIPSHREYIIETNELTKRFGNFTAVDKVSLHVKTGEVFGLLGPNGAGKSTIFKMLCGLLRTTSGSAVVNGLDLKKAPAKAREHIGYMAQKFSLYGELSLLQNLDFFSGVYAVDNIQQRESTIKKIIEIFNFQNYLEQNAILLPLGYKQRLALACAVLHHPEIIFLDEPTSGVDPITRREFWSHINGLVEKGTTVMITTHFMDEAENCDRIALIYQSKLITIGTPDELKEKAKTKENPDPTLEDAFIYLIGNFNIESYAR